MAKECARIDELTLANGDKIPSVGRVPDTVATRSTGSSVLHVLELVPAAGRLAGH